MSNIIIPITGLITEDTYKAIFNILKEAKTTDKITIFINSGGGSIDDGIAIYEFIKSLKLEIDTVAIGKCCSVATVIFSLGKKRYIAPNTRYLLHGASVELNKGRFSQKNFQDLLSEAKKYNQKIISCLLASPGDLRISERALKKLFEDGEDHTFDSKEALEDGFATDVADDVGSILRKKEENIY